MRKNKMFYLSAAITLTLCIMLVRAEYSAAAPRGPLKGAGPLMHCIQQLNLPPETLTAVAALVEARQAIVALE